MVRRRVDPCGLAKILRRMVPAGEAATVVFEDVHAFPGTRNSPQAQSSLMHSRGMVEAVVELARITETGTLQLEALPVGGSERWKVEFDVRGQA